QRRRDRGPRARPTASSVRRLVALRVGRDVAGRIPPHDGRELAARPRDDGDLQAEPLSDQLLALPLELRGRDVGREHDVPALLVRGRVLEARVHERIPKLGHRNAVAGAEVDAAEKDDLPLHASTTAMLKVAVPSDRIRLSHSGRYISVALAAWMPPR